MGTLLRKLRSQATLSKSPQGAPSAAPCPSWLKAQMMMMMMCSVFGTLCVWKCKTSVLPPPVLGGRSYASVSKYDWVFGGRSYVFGLVPPSCSRLRMYMTPCSFCVRNSRPGYIATLCLKHSPFVFAVFRFAFGVLMLFLLVLFCSLSPLI